MRNDHEASRVQDRPAQGSHNAQDHDWHNQCYKDHASRRNLAPAKLCITHDPSRSELYAAIQTKDFLDKMIAYLWRACRKLCSDAPIIEQHIKAIAYCMSCRVYPGEQ